MLEAVGRYRIQKPLGKGAMGVVYLASDPLLNRLVAIKTIDLNVDEASRREFLQTRLLRDARAAAALTHPHIVGIYDVVAEGEVAAIVMEFVEGENLSSYLERNPLPDAAFIVRIVRDMAGALDYTHARGIVHRDIKPANVMLDAAQNPKITDFGIARITEGVTATMTGLVMGTLEYMAPEQVKGEKVDGRADQFALAVVAYRMLTGQSLFGDHSVATLAYKIVNENPPSVCSVNTSLPPAVDAALFKAFSKDPNARYVSCSDFAAALSAALMPARAATTIATVPPLPPTVATAAAAAVATAPSAAATAQASKSKAPIFAIAGLLAAAAALGSVLVWRPWLSQPSPAAQTPPLVASTPPQQSAPAKPAAAQPTETPAPPATAKSAKTAREKTKPAAVETASITSSPSPPVSTGQPAAKTAPPADVDPADAVEASAPRPAVIAFHHGHDLIGARDYSGALAAFTTAINLRPQWAQAYNGRGSAYQGLQQFDAAIRDYTQAIRLNPTLFKVYLSRAECYVKLHQDDAALADYNQAISIKPEAPLALTARAEIFMRRRAPRKALADWDAVIRLQPENVLAYRKRAVVRNNLGDAAGAAADNRKAAELSK